LKLLRVSTLLDSIFRISSPSIFAGTVTARLRPSRSTGPSTICMQTKDYERAYEAFVAKKKPVFEGN
jgi:hypothetical protein